MGRISAAEFRNRIRRARSEGEVVGIVDAYVRELPPEVVAALPFACRPLGLASREEIVGYTVELARGELVFDGPAEHAALLREMLGVMNEAATRFAQLGAEPRPGPAESP